MRRLKVVRRPYKIETIPASLIDATEKFMLAKRTEILFGLVCTIVGGAVMLIMLLWLLHQIRVSFYL